MDNEWNEAIEAAADIVRKEKIFWSDSRFAGPYSAFTKRAFLADLESAIRALARPGPSVATGSK